MALRVNWSLSQPVGKASSSLRAVSLAFLRRYARDGTLKCAAPLEPCGSTGKSNSRAPGTASRPASVPKRGGTRSMTAARSGRPAINRVWLNAVGCSLRQRRKPKALRATRNSVASPGPGAARGTSPGRRERRTARTPVHRAATAYSPLCLLAGVASGET